MLRCSGLAISRKQKQIGARPSPLALAAGPVRWVTLVTGPANPPIRSYSGTERHSGEKNAEKLLAPGETRTPNCAGADLGRLEGGDAAWTQ